MKCVLSTEKCVYSHELSLNKVSVDQFDEGVSPQKLKSKLSHVRQSSATSTAMLKLAEDSTRTPDHKNFVDPHLSRESSSELVGVSMKASIDTGLVSNNNFNQNADINSIDIEKTTTPRHSGSDEASLSNNEANMKRSPSSASISADNLQLKGSTNRLGKLKKNRKPKLSNEGSESNELSSDDDDDDKGAVNSNNSLMLESQQQFHLINNANIGVSGGIQSGQRLSLNSLSSNIFPVPLRAEESVIGSQVKLDEIFLSFTDLEGMVIVKRIAVNRNATDLGSCFANPTNTYSVDLGITGSYCRFVKCMDVEVRQEKQALGMLSKKQQRKQVKFMQRNKLSATKEEEEQGAKEEIKSNEIVQEEPREVNLNLIVTNLMGEVIEFKNVPFSGLKNPQAFPTVDPYNSGVTGLCIKTIDSLEILVSYFDGSVIFFDMNSEDAWNLKLSQPLNSNHFGVYYENTYDTDIVILISDDTIQIYELNSYQIN